MKMGSFKFIGFSILLTCLSSYAHALESDGVYIRTTVDMTGEEDFALRDLADNEIFFRVSSPEASAPYGFVDAWLDLNGDGRFTVNEQIIFSQPLLDDAVNPAGSPSGLGQKQRIVRFETKGYTGPAKLRLVYSEMGGVRLSDSLDALEVEELTVQLRPKGQNPWHHELLPTDVNANGAVTIRDLHGVIRENIIRNFTYGEGEPIPGSKQAGDFLPEWAPHMRTTADVPIFLDVNNDLRVDQNDLDVLLNSLTTIN